MQNLKRLRAWDTIKRLFTQHNGVKNCKTKYSKFHSCKCTLYQY